MSAMTGNQQRTARPPRRRRRALLVLAVLAGLLGMHALGPGGGAGHPARAHTGHRTAVAVMVGDACPDGHRDGGHLHHADPSCASAAVKDGPRPPALVPDPVTTQVRAEAPRSRAVAAPDGARAPPTLAELQLLRI